MVERIPRSITHTLYTGQFRWICLLLSKSVRTVASIGWYVHVAYNFRAFHEQSREDFGLGFELLHSRNLFIIADHSFTPVIFHRRNLCSSKHESFA